MATTMDALLRITASADTSALGNLQHSLLSVQSAGKSASTGLGMLGTALGAATGGVVALGVGIGAAGVIEFAKSSIDAADNMRDLSQRTGASVEVLSKFQQAANMSGSSIEAVGGAMVKLSRGMAEAAETGKGPAAEALRTLGISAVDAAGQLKGADQVMLEVADRFQQMPDGAQKAALAVQLFGRSGAELIPTLNEGRQAIEGLNANMSTEFANKADAYNDSVERLKITFARLGTVLAEQFLPIMQQTVHGLTDLGISLRILNLPFANDKAAEIAAIKQEIISLRTEREKFGQGGVLPSDPEEDGAAVGRIQQATGETANLKGQQEAFKAAIQQSNMEYELMGATITATGQAIELNNKLADATLNADIAVNNAAKSILQTKLGQARTEGEKMRIMGQIMELDLQNAALQKQAAEAQIRAEVTIADLKRRSAWQELRKAQAAIATAAAHGQDTRQMVYQLELAKQAANLADREYITAGRIADERLRVADAQYRAMVFQARAAAQAGRQAGSQVIQQVNALGTFYSDTNPAGGSVAGQRYRTTYLPGGGSVSELVPAFAGGGYTGDAPRSGGLDGRGGFMAMLHPRETVIDHGRSGAAPSITIQTGPVMQQADGSQWVSMGDLQAAMQATAAAVMGTLRTPGARVALRGA